MSFKAVIFDRDGVLTDFNLEAAEEFFKPLLPWSLSTLSRRWQQYGQKVGFPSTVSDEELFFHGFWDTIASELQLTTEQYQRLLEFNYIHCLRAWPDARPAMSAARRTGMYVGVLSNFSLASLDSSLAGVGLADLVDIACAATVIGYAKPEPESYLTVANALRVQPQECLFFDDEVVCVQGAQAVGMTAYLVDCNRVNHDLDQNVICSLSIVTDFVKM